MTSDFLHNWLLELSIKFDSRTESLRKRTKNQQIAPLRKPAFCIVLWSCNYLSLVPTCPNNRKNRGFLRFSDVWDSYNQWEHHIPDIPEGRRLLRRHRKNRKHFYFEGPSQTVFTMSLNLKILLPGTSGMLDFLFLLPKLDFQ